MIPTRIGHGKSLAVVGSPEERPNGCSTIGRRRAKKESAQRSLGNPVRLPKNDRRESFLQGLKPIESKRLMSEPKLRRPKEKTEKKPLSQPPARLLRLLAQASRATLKFVAGRLGIGEPTGGAVSRLDTR